MESRTERERGERELTHPADEDQQVRAGNTNSSLAISMEVML